jgi:hypothetical protein
MEYLSLLQTYGSFLVATAVFYAIGKVMKQGPLSPQRAKEVRWVRFVRRWFPLPLHPICAGAALGLLTEPPVPEWWPHNWAWLYFAGAGVASLVWHDVYREWLKHKGKADPGDDGGLGLSVADTASVPPKK